MTPLAKPVRRIVRDREGNYLVATLEPHGLSMRMKGQRTQFPAIPWGLLYLTAAKLHVASQDADKRNKGAK